MAGWASNNLKPNSGSLEGNEMVIQDLVLSQNSGLKLMQNCDLPPPVKVFSGPDKAVFSSMNDRIYSTAVEEGENEELGLPRSGNENDKLELLKALRLSQTRAREAEKKAAVLAKERDCLWNALLEDSSRLFAYRQWVKLLEHQLSKLQKQHQKSLSQFCGGCSRLDRMNRSPDKEDDGEDLVGVTWFGALALCLGLAGVGFAFGCRYFF